MAKKRKSGPNRPRSQTGKVQPPEDEAALWQAFTQNIDPLELKGRVPNTEGGLFDELLRREQATERAKTRPPPPAQSPTSTKPAPRTPAISRVIATPSPPPAGQIDTRQVRRIGNGREGIDARIDLHGMRQSEAHSALRVFLFRSVAKGHRMVLVITGKGKAQSLPTDGDRFGPFVHEGAPDRGVLRRNVPLWLAEPDLRAIIVGHIPAHIRHGGDGALYVQLRRQRQP